MPFSRLEKIQFLLLLFFLLLEFILFHELLLFSQVTVHMFFWQTAETVNPCKGLQFPCHHAWLSRSSGLIEQFFSSLIPHTVFKFLYIILPSLFSLILPKSCSHHWASASHSSCLLGNVHPFLPNSPQYRGIKCTEQQKIVPGSYKAAIGLSEAADATAIPVPPTENNTECDLQSVTCWVLLSVGPQRLAAAGLSRPVVSRPAATHGKQRVMV